jgi:hypothetical protein
MPVLNLSDSQTLALGSSAVKAAYLGSELKHFNPKAISGLEGWFDASQIVASDLDGNGNVETWRNLGSGGDATNGTANNRPTPTASALNGRQVLTFDGSNDRLGWTVDSLSDASVFFIHRANVPAAGVSTIYEIIGPGANAGQAGGVYNNVKNDSGASELQLSVGGFTTGVNRFNYTWLSGGYGSGNGEPYGPKVISVSWSPAGLVGRENGTQIGTATTPGSLQPATFGANRNETSFPLDGYIAEILIYTPRLSDSQVIAVERYLGQKWGLTVA